MLITGLLIIFKRMSTGIINIMKCTQLLLMDLEFENVRFFNNFSTFSLRIIILLCLFS